MSLFPVTPLVLPVKCDAQVFCETKRGFFYPLLEVKEGTEVSLGRQIPLSGMFDLFEVQARDLRVGYMFRSTFSVENGGGYLLAHMKTKRLAEEHEVLLKLDSLVIYNFPNRGTLAVSPKVGSAFRKILESQ
jgi:hypothetical protein